MYLQIPHICSTNVRPYTELYVFLIRFQRYIIWFPSYTHQMTVDIE